MSSLYLFYVRLISIICLRLPKDEAVYPETESSNLIYKKYNLYIDINTKKLKKCIYIYIYISELSL